MNNNKYRIRDFTNKHLDYSLKVMVKVFFVGGQPSPTNNHSML